MNVNLSGFFFNRLTKGIPLLTMLLKELVNQILDQKYQIEKILGQGGMGAVYLATHLGTKRQVALKVIAPKFMDNREFVERFKREAEALGMISVISLSMGISSVAA